MSAPQFPEAVKRAQAAIEMRKQQANIALAEATAQAQFAQQSAMQELQKHQLEQRKGALQDISSILEARHNDEAAAANMEAKRKEAEFKQRQKQQQKLGGKSPTQATVEAALAGTESNGRNLNQTSPDFAGGDAVGALMESLGAGGPQPGGPGGAGMAASTGQPTAQVGSNTYSAPAQITSTQRTQGTQWQGPAGPFQEFIGLPEDTTVTRTEDNVMRPVDIANIQLQQQQQQLQTFLQLREDGQDPGVAMAFAEAASTGDGFAMAAAASKLGKGLGLRTKEAALNGVMLDNQTKKVQLAMYQQLLREQGAQASVDPLGLMGYKASQGGAFGMTAGGKLSLGSGSRSGGNQGAFDLGEMVTAANSAIGKGKPDEPNSLALQSLQVGFLQGSNGRIMAMVPPKDGSWFGGGTAIENGMRLYNTADLVAKVRAAASDPTALNELLQSGLFIQAPGGGAIVPNPGSPNAANAIALANYVQGSAQLQATNPGWVDPLAGSGGIDISAALKAAQPPATAKAAGDTRLAELEAARKGLIRTNKGPLAGTGNPYANIPGVADLDAEIARTKASNKERAQAAAKAAEAQRLSDAQAAARRALGR